MRIYRLRYDALISLLLAFLLAWAAGKAAGLIVPVVYEGYLEKHTVAAGDIGGEAGADVFRAQSVEDLLTHETFTIVSEGIRYRNEGGGYYGNFFFYSVALPSGERVAAAINMAAVQTDEDSYYSGEAVLPVGRVVYEDLTSKETFLDQIEYDEPLTRRDFYVDMMGHGGAMGQESYGQGIISTVQLVTGVLAFPLLHALGARLGLFPYFFPPKKRKEQEWD